MKKNKEVIATTQFLLAGKFLNKVQLKEIDLVLKNGNVFEIIENEMKEEYIAEGIKKGHKEGIKESKSEIAGDVRR